MMRQHWNDIRSKVVLAYGANRNLSDSLNGRHDVLSPDVRRVMTLFDPHTQVASAEVLLQQNASEQTPLFRLFQPLLRQVFGDDLGFEIRDGRVVFTDKGEPVEPIDLPDGFRSSVAWLVDLCAAWCEKSTSMEQSSIPGRGIPGRMIPGGAWRGTSTTRALNERPSDIEAIVLIDEIHLHLHPSLQRMLVPRLRKALPRVQWVVTTHSPLVLSSFDTAEIVALDRDEPGGVRFLDRQILGFTTDQIYEWLMGTPPTSAAIEQELDGKEPSAPHSDEELEELLMMSPDVSAEEAKKRSSRTSRTTEETGTMRSIRRARARVPTLAPGGVGWGRAAQDLAARKVDGNVELPFPEHWNESDVRGALYAAQGKVCAYCGSHLPRNDRGDIDHFRPKSCPRDDPFHGGYWWLAYVFDNYLLSCSTCNRIYKSNQFPLRPRARWITFHNRARLVREARLLLDPARDPIEQWLRVDWRKPLCPIHPAERLSSTARSQVSETLEVFHINKDPRLVRQRMKVVDAVDKDIKDGRITRARIRAIRYRAHSLIARQILIDKGEESAPCEEALRLPTPQEELRWLLSSRLGDLDLALRLLEVHGPDKRAEQEKEEALWSLATLWCDPPGGTRAEVEAFLMENEVLDPVRVYAQGVIGDQRDHR